MSNPIKRHPMKTLLQLTSSLFASQGQSSRLAEAFVAQWRAANPDGRVIARDLSRNPVPHLDADGFAAFLAKPESRTVEQQAVIRLSYFDRVARAGVTFRYTEKGAMGLLTGKKAYVFATRGGRYLGTPLDLETGFVRQFLGFIGIEDLEFVYAEGLAIDERSKSTALAAAHDTIERIVAADSLALAA
jgi:FMN-dependent NADH-azoreductase